MIERTLSILELDKILAELASLAHTPLGRERCERLLPSDELAVAQAGQDETDDAVKLILERGVPPLGGFSDIRPAVRQAVSGSTLSCGELMRIGIFLRATDRLARTRPSDAAPRILYDLMGRLNGAPDLARRLDLAIAGENEVADAASPQLASLRRRIRLAQEEIKETLARIVRSHAKALQDQLVTLRGDRYVVPVKAEHRGDIPGLVHDTSSSGATLFIEPMPVVERNNKIRELSGLEREEIERILREFSRQVAAVAELILADAETVGGIDFITAKGRLALQMQAMPPLLNDRGRIRLRAARHPLIKADRVVPIDLELGLTFRTLVITGPNTGGKTVALKTCGLLCLMAMAGLQIPAREHSETAVFKQVLADIGDEQSIEQDLSTFSAHMRNLVEITRRAGPDTLVLVDELGSGTDPSEGAALAMAILDHLRRRGCLTVATTHYKELKVYALQTDGVENACCEFDSETLRPTYRILIGVPGVSNAFAISGRLGLDEPIIAQARTLMDAEGAHFEELISAVERSRSEAEKVRREILAEREHLSTQAAQLREQKRQLAEDVRQAGRKARQEAREEYAEALREVESLLEALRREDKERDLERQLSLAEQTRQELRAGLSRLDAAVGQDALAGHGEQISGDDLILGETYAAPTLGLSGRLTEGPDSRGQVLLRSGDLSVRVPLEALRHPAPEPENSGKRRPRTSAGTRKRAADSLSMDRHMNLQSEIQLLGQTVEEATSNLDKFLDDATLAGIRQVRVVHGKGTGALRAAVQRMLRSDSRVSSFRLGAYGEGDSGVTVAELR